jgi:uncharacterized protein
VTNRETRALRGAACELRAEGEGKTLVGYAAVYGELSEDLGGFRERVLPGAFSLALSRGADVRALINHDENRVLGRTASGTLRLLNTTRGLRYEADLPETQYARDLRESVRRGDVDGSSFAFEAVAAGWAEELLGGERTLVRELKEVNIFDVSVVTYPAYPQTEVALRSLGELKLTREQADGLKLGALLLELYRRRQALAEVEC